MKPKRKDHSALSRIVLKTEHIMKLVFQKTRTQKVVNFFNKTDYKDIRGSLFWKHRTLKKYMGIHEQSQWNKQRIQISLRQATT